MATRKTDYTITELAELSGKAVSTVYALAKKLGRKPTLEEIKAVKRGAPRKY